jgi:hypothetical protein
MGSDREERRRGKASLVMSIWALSKFLAKCNCSIFVVIWQLVSNHGLIRLKRFVSSISSKLCNLFYFLSIFNALYIRPKIQCDEESTVLL